jgi:hypothetical protein
MAVMTDHARLVGRIITAATPADLIGLYIVNLLRQMSRCGFRIFSTMKVPLPP